MLNKLGKAYAPQLEVVPLLILVLGFYAAASNIDSLPQEIPTHFNIQGLPDGWGNKNDIFVGPFVGALIYVILTVIVAAFVMVSDPMRLINLPNKQKMLLTPGRAEELRIFMVRALFVMKVVMMSMTAYITWATVEMAFGREQTLGGLFYILLGGVLAATGAITWKSLSLTHTKPRVR